MAKVVVKQGEEEVTKEVLADAIVAISQHFQKLLNSGLNRKAVVALLKDATAGRFTKGQIDDILQNLVNLRELYCK